MLKHEGYRNARFSLDLNPTINRRMVVISNCVFQLVKHSRKVCMRTRKVE